MAVGDGAEGYSVSKPCICVSTFSFNFLGFDLYQPTLASFLLASFSSLSLVLFSRTLFSALPNYVSNGELARETRIDVCLFGALWIISISFLRFTCRCLFCPVRRCLFSFTFHRYFSVSLPTAQSVLSLSLSLPPVLYL